MKVALLADLHLGFGYTRQGSDDMREDSFRNAESAIRIAAERADLILIAGDLFDRPRFSTDVFLRALDIFDIPRMHPSSVRVAGGSKKVGSFFGTPVVAIRGNHDVGGDLNSHPVILLERAHRLIYLHRNSIVFEGDSGDRVAITGVGWIPSKRPDRLLEFFSSHVPQPVSDAYNILMIHQPLKNMDVHSAPEVLGANAGETPLPISVLPTGYDLYLAGHIHRHLHRNIGGYNIVMPGSTVRTQWIDSEVEADRRFWILDTSTGSLEEVVIPTARKGRVVRVDVSGMSPAEARDAAAKSLAAAIADLPHDPKPIIKLVLTGRSEGILDLSSVVDRFADRAIVRVFDNTSSALAEAIASAVAEHQANTQLFSREYARSVLDTMMAKLGLAPGPDFDAFLSQILIDDAPSSAKDALIDRIMNFILNHRVFAHDSSSSGDTASEQGPKKPSSTILDWSSP
ncbi:MAG: DNA repair exonuclease [Candidatus Diapherotrites archaeon]|nr:DNA repair exonuclease [Candidatus Diapherotrites archaeon]